MNGPESWGLKPRTEAERDADEDLRVNGRAADLAEPAEQLDEESEE